MHLFIYSFILSHRIASFLLFSREVHCMEEALTVAAFSSVSHLFLEAPTDHEEKNEYEKTMGELVVSHSAKSPSHSYSLSLSPSHHHH